MPEDLETATGDFTPLFDTGELEMAVDDAASPPATTLDDMTLDYLTLDSPVSEATASDDAPSAALPTPVLPAPVLPTPVLPAVVEGSYRYLKWWTLVGVLAAVWCVAAAAGAGLYYYWFQSADKTWPVFAVLSYVVVITVGALMASTAQRKSAVSALAIALMSAPLASMAAAAVFYGAYVFGWIAR